MNTTNAKVAGNRNSQAMMWSRFLRFIRFPSIGSFSSLGRKREDPLSSLLPIDGMSYCSSSILFRAS